MKCEQVRISIEDYVDGVLDAKASTAVKAHLDGCAECESVHRQLSREQEIYARYERDVEITPMLWASIESRIKEDRAERSEGWFARLRESLAAIFAAPRLSPAFAAALVIIAIGVTIGVMSYLNSRGSGTQVAGNPNNSNQSGSGANQVAKPVDQPAPGGSAEGGTVASNNSGRNNPKNSEGTNNEPGPVTVVKPAAPQRRLVAATALTPTQLVQDAEQKYLAAISMLSRDMNKNRSKLDPIMLARFDASLSEIDRTIKETRRVVRENPSDPIALQYLLAAYSKKVEVLRGMTTD